MALDQMPFSVSGQTIRGFFSEIPRTYDWINTLMTGGLDQYWRKRASRLAAAAGGNVWLDICAGTGQMTLQLVSRAKRIGERKETEKGMNKTKPARKRKAIHIIALDFSTPMLALLEVPPGDFSIYRCLGDVSRLPFPAASFDLVTVSFATRNLHSSRDDLVSRFGEIRRVLKPGGRFMNLETSQPASPLIRKLFHGFLGLTVHLVGTLISGASFPYRYLASSVKTFYPAEELANLLREAGFVDVTHQPMTFGAVAAHLAWKR